ncbi:transcription factor RAX2-like [Panicum miliaceum]|uniref:Transcription factor RAX2-like n=1 Tax=Panicum miliaceum TaxID=4540 RepID=A0A3L6TU28_PANMI|nr:transcription factor RAX2-like [Panicum miliaceum]
MTMKKGKWSKEEDNLIKNHIEKYGIDHSWQALSNTLGLRRCGRSCRSRWLNYLRPGLKHGNFTPAEEKIICEMYSKRGSCWSVIAAQLPGRTDLAIKNYWNSTLKKKFSAARTSTATAYRRRNLPACSTSSDAGTPARDLQLVSYGSEESSTAGSSPAKPVLAGPTPVPVVAAQPITAVPVSGPVKIEQKQAVVSLPRLGKTPAPPPPPPPPPPRACDQTGERVMDIVCAPMSPVPLSFMEPDELACIYQFDDIDSFLPWFDHH